MCPARYKSSVIISAIRRAHKICSTRELFFQEIKKCKQILVNNGFTNSEFDHELKEFLRTREQRQLPANNKNKIKIYCKNFMSNSYKTGERIIRNIVEENVDVTNGNDELELIIYYNRSKTAQLVM